MKIRQLLCGMMLLSGALTATGQYFGTPLFVEGFDGDEFPTEWTQRNTVDATLWTAGSPGSPDFTPIDPSSVRSARISVNSKATVLTLTSPVIDATGRSSLQTGFYGHELSYAFRGGVDFRFRVSNDGGSTWTDLFSSADGSSYTGTPVGKWNLYKYELPAGFNDKELMLQFYIDATAAYIQPQGLAGYIDGVFLSLLPEVDPELTDINYSTNDLRPTEGIFTASEPLELTVRNSGTRELAEAEFWYRVDGGNEHSELCVFPEPIAPGESYTFSFTGGADLSAIGHVQTILAGVRAEGDIIDSNNQITAYVENQVVAVPYIPFIHEEDGITTTSTDGWRTFENNSEWGWDWEDWNSFYWYVEPEYNDDPNDAFLVSRPIAMQAGNAYRIEFSAVTEDELDGLNKMKVYVSTDADMESDLHEVWSNDNITDVNAVEQSAVFTAPESGIYYVGFHSLSEPGAGVMRLENIAFYRNVDVDVALVAVKSPVASAYSYSDAEPVKVVVANYGSRPVAAGSATVYLDVDGETVLSEPLGTGLAPNSKTEFTFSGTVDLSDLGTAHDIRLRVELAGDEDPANDAMEFRLESELTLVPYIPDMGSAVSKGSDIARWTVADNNGDGYDFVARSDTQLDAYVFSYGGGLYGFTTVTLPSSDESLVSRHIRLEGGKTYKLSYLTRVGMDGGSIPLDIKLVNTADESLADIASVTVDDVNYRENIHVFSVESDGIYQLRFDVRHDKPIDYRIYLGKFRLAEKLGCDLSVEKIILPSRKVSEIRSYPVGVSLRNNGSSVVRSFTIEAVSESIGRRSREFANVELEPDGEYTVYFNEDFVFNGTGSEKLTVSVSTDGDEHTANNSADAVLDYIEPFTLPYSQLPNEAIDYMAAFNLNRDAFSFNTDRTMGVGYTYLSDGSVEANDYLATPAVKLAAGHPTRVSFSFYVLEGDTTDVEVFAYDAGADVRVPVIVLNEISQTVMNRYTGFFSVPSDGAYSICISPRGKTRSLFVNASVSIDEADCLPDLALTRLLSHDKAAVLGDNERVEVEFVSNSEQGVQGVPFELHVGERVYHSLFTRYTTLCSDGDAYTVAFDGVDLSAPGTHEVLCRAIVPLDSRPDDNEMKFEITSLPVVDVAVVSLDSPVSGKLGKSETVSVSVANKGKGDIAGLKLKCDVGCPDGQVINLESASEIELAHGATVQFSFPTTVDLYTEGVYTFTITAVAEGDVNDADNTLTVQVNSTHKDFDAGVSALLSPVDAALGNEVSLTVAVSNYGEAELFDVPVRAEVSYSGEDAVTIEGIVASLPVGETVEYTFGKTVDMKRCGTYTIKAFTYQPGDVNADNDSFTATVRCLTQDVGVSAILSPVTGEELGICDVTVMVTNYGEAEVSEIPMRYQIGTMPQLAVMTQTLEPGESREFTFPVPYEFTSYRKAVVKASTMLDNDVNPDNDSMELEVENLKSGVSDVRLITAVWPNPTRGEVKVSAAREIACVQAYDMAGHLLAEFAGNGGCDMQLNLDVPAGRYMLRIVFADGSSAVSHVVKI